MLNKNYEKILICIIKKYLPECKIYLFGSRAKGTNTATSDIDVAVDDGKEITLSILGHIKEDIEESTIPFFVDVVDLNLVTESMKDQILKYGILWKT